MSAFRIGRNGQGCWIVQADNGLCGGVFADQASALKFALIESRHRRLAVVMVPDVLDLDFIAPPACPVSDGTRRVA